MWPSNPTSRYINPKELKRGTKHCTRMFVAAPFTTAKRKKCPNPCPVPGEHNAVHLNDTASSRKRCIMIHEWHRPRQRHAVWTKPRTASREPCDSIYRKCPEQAHPETESSLVAAGGNTEGLLMGVEFPFGWWKWPGMRQRCWLHSPMNILNATVLYTLKRFKC